MYENLNYFRSKGLPCKWKTQVAGRGQAGSATIAGRVVEERWNQFVGIVSAMIWNDLIKWQHKCRMFSSKIFYV